MTDVQAGSPGGGAGSPPASPGGGGGDDMDFADQSGGLSRMKMSRSSPALGSYDDLKQKTAFGGSTQGGVLKRQTYMTSLSNYRAGPSYTLGPRGPSMLARKTMSPAPGTYNLPPDDKSKFKMASRFSFGGGSRFGLGESPIKKMPGPGAYNPHDPTLHTESKVGFGTATRGRGNLMSQANPGPGAYEYRSCVGQGLMFSAGGRHPTSYMRARSLPGPGAYDPSDTGTANAQRKVGFGTGTRGEATRQLGPGPGTYELAQFKGVGTDAPKFSATSRRRSHDLESYTSPGPGTYNSHATTFGPQA